MRAKNILAMLVLGVFLTWFAGCRSSGSRPYSGDYRPYPSSGCSSCGS